MFRYIPFDEIDKNKWNGTVHYAHNGNVQGYHWYLKAIVHEWGAIIENDYETVMPVIEEPLKPHQYALLRELGPYSVNPLNERRMAEMMPLLLRHNKSGQYPLNNRVTSSVTTDFTTTKRTKAVYLGGKSYDALADSYGDELQQNLYGDAYDKVKIMSGLKPEKIVDLIKDTEPYKNALMRVMYNAMHRGVGFSNGLEDKDTGEVLAISFFLGMPSVVTELVTFSTGDKKYRQLIFDLILRNNSQKASRIESYQHTTDLTEMGFDTEPVYDLQLKTSTIQNIKKAFGGAY